MKYICFASLAALMLLTGCIGNKEKHAGGEMKEVVDSTVINERIAEITEADVKNSIRSFYNDYVLGNKTLDDETAQRLCTEKMRKRLLEEYSNEYGNEDPGYAVWIFRTGAQDGPSNESRVVDIVNAGQRGYEVMFLDMGIQGRSVINVVIDEGYVKIDNVTVEK